MEHVERQVWVFVACFRTILHLLHLNELFALGDAVLALVSAPATIHHFQGHYYLGGLIWAKENARDSTLLDDVEVVLAEDVKGSRRYPQEVHPVEHGEMRLPQSAEVWRASMILLRGDEVAYGVIVTSPNDSLHGAVVVGVEVVAFFVKASDVPRNCVDVETGA